MDSEATSHRQSGYVSYLLRLWPAEGNEASSCRASLESLHSERHGFASLDALVAFVAQKATTLNVLCACGDRQDDQIEK
jgi:hypothetical protein